jgi:ribosomal protein L11 methyltransferase
VPTSWLQLSLFIDPAALDVASNFLVERGSNGVVVKRREIRAYFRHSDEDAVVKKDVQRFLSSIERFYPHFKLKPQMLRWRIIEDRNWNSTWQKFFTPQKIGKSFWVVPPWEKMNGSKSRHTIIIEPGMAFGTGTHATTRGCMVFIEKVVGSFCGSAFTALDVGTGSGILTIAMAKLGAQKVWALDSDPVAIKVARENLRTNGVEKKVHLSTTRLSRVRKAFSLVVANLTAETILELAAGLEKKVARPGYLILSGILNAKAAEIIRRFSAVGMKVVTRRREKEWTTLLFTRN